MRGVRKARFARPGTGKSSGGRVIYYLGVSAHSLFMMTAFPKSERDDLSPEQRKAILAVIEGIKESKP
ncbi:MAG TPA: type II toxin-antitoxin system RelE/ParE family toxin [Propylenella sp.]